LPLSERIGIHNSYMGCWENSSCPGLYELAGRTKPSGKITAQMQPHHTQNPSLGTAFQE
jgi:hypothetical protein